MSNRKRRSGQQAREMKRFMGDPRITKADDLRNDTLLIKLSVERHRRNRNHNDDGPLAA